MVAIGGLPRDGHVGRASEDQPSLPLLCDFTHADAVRLRADGPAEARPTRRMAARLSRTGRLHCMMAEPSRGPPSPQASTPTTVGEAPAVPRRGWFVPRQKIPPLVAPVGPRPISRLTKEYNLRLHGLLAGDRDHAGGRPVSPQVTEGAQLAEREADALAARSRGFNSRIGDLLSALDNTDLRKLLVGDLQAPTGSPPRSADKRPVRRHRKHSPSPTLADDGVREDTAWFLAEDSSGPQGSSRSPTARSRGLYFTSVLRALRTRPDSVAAFEERISRIKQMKSDRAAERAAVEGDFPKRNWDMAFRPPADRREEQLRRFKTVDTRRQKVWSAAEVAEAEQFEKKLAGLTEERQGRLRRMKAMAVMFWLSKAQCVFSDRVMHWRRRAEEQGWTRRKRALRLLTETASQLRAHTGQLQVDGELPAADLQRAMRAVHDHEEVARKVARQVLADHFWLFSFRMRVLRKKRAVVVILKMLRCEARKSRVSSVLKQVLSATRRIQRWWVSRFMLLRCSQDLMQRQWVRCMRQLSAFDAERVSKVLGPNAKRAVLEGKPRSQSFARRPADRRGSMASSISIERKDTMSKKTASAVAGPRGVRGAVRKGPPEQHRKGALRRNESGELDDRPRPHLHQHHPHHPHHRDTTSIATVARFIMDTMHRDQIDLEPPSPIRRKIFSYLFTRERCWFRARMIHWLAHAAAVEEEKRQLAALLRAKAEIQPLAREDHQRLENSSAPPMPIQHRVLQPNEMRLCIAVAFQAYRSEMMQSVARRGGDLAHEALSSPIESMDTLLREFKVLQEDLSLGGVWEGFWVPLPVLTDELKRGLWNEPRNTRSTESQHKHGK
eukprot:TRINITY_DN20954_c0_g1_i1.p1 TRINITY_DN20954_c0_g1~~TRINITY_DN20954_c0_g1_i1.p1  ORF type:complete len:839 (+),score=205.48 TRINITY_DN20954_c0_g1_i1:45-2561(+)